MINIKNIRKSFEDMEAVKNVSLHINKGSIYGLLGSNGAGKTTLLKILAGIYRQDSGEVQIDNQSVFENVQIKQKIIFLPDTLFFFSQYTIKQMADYYRSLFPSWNEERYQRLGEVFPIDQNKKVHRLSKGMQRQVAFWLTLSTMPEVLILDEPLDGLDAVMRQKVKNLLVQDVAEREMTVLISSHNLREVEDICDHVGILHHGEIMIERDLDDLKSDIHKIQVAFKAGETPAEFLQDLDVLYQEACGSVLLCIVRGKEEDVKDKVQSFHPVLFDILPLTLEEIFIYEMGDVGYAIESIMV
ncbi:ABC-type multidrug transport system, ATPase component [Schinkia azotoformans MEV2011]|uniref:ABC-type multidrug transport system, ATPase component n=1 Tax=Schinkia azotoformans MEV2011 TaxID=1348973 RepID=A0A072NNF6_SCHAZ|nr:ABC transporter ATP-binding protein [Schinkia azotoformans]KEF38458.1 ABC-type multidrug transport system, ATPase component [Schinkia azotoformans MEV2011]MEC1697475.1 ABC transporter ATP-binding protein [Schinkia azotoformans]MEC1714364.1 ABC transporter ATP-binding protein [Schinkia azotoformans]MEC1724527.1 ABC transporter ATP-binding protein [Schinkia azotoformans]MEC1741221.1 ABC transporter ATP-binding protein [Schinkia azotoformans]